MTKCGVWNCTNIPRWWCSAGFRYCDNHRHQHRDSRTSKFHSHRRYYPVITWKSTISSVWMEHGTNAIAINHSQITKFSCSITNRIPENHNHYKNSTDVKTHDRRNRTGSRRVGITTNIRFNQRRYCMEVHLQRSKERTLGISLWWLCPRNFSWFLSCRDIKAR